MGHLVFSNVDRDFYSTASTNSANDRRIYQPRAKATVDHDLYSTNSALPTEKSQHRDHDFFFPPHFLREHSFMTPLDHRIYSRTFFEFLSVFLSSCSVFLFRLNSSCPVYSYNQRSAPRTNDFGQPPEKQTGRSTLAILKGSKT